MENGRFSKVFADKDFLRSLFALSLPLCAQNLLTFLLSVSDNVMIGRLGEGQNAGVFVGSQVQLLLQMLLSGIEGGMLIVATQYNGKGERENVKRICAFSFQICFFTGALLFLVSFFFSDKISAIF